MSTVKRKIRVQFDIDVPVYKGFKDEGTSMTVPDQSITVRQLLENHTRGVGNDVKIHQPLYFETELPVLRDITDVAVYKAALQERLEKVNEFMANEIAELDAAKAAQDGSGGGDNSESGDSGEA